MSRTVGERSELPQDETKGSAGGRLIQSLEMAMYQETR